MVMSEAENVIEAEIGGLVMVIGFFVAMRNLLRVSDVAAGAIQSLTSQGENLRPGLNWLCLAMTLLKALF